MRTFSALIAICLITAACGRFERAQQQQASQVDETGNESAQTPRATPQPIVEQPAPAATPAPDATDGATPAPEAAQTDIPAPHNPLERPPAKEAPVLLKLQQVTNLRYEKDGVMEWKQDLPEGSIIAVQPPYQIKMIDYRTTSGGTERSSTGFIGPIKILSVPDKSLDAQAMQALNETDGGLFVIGSVVNANQPVEGEFAKLTASEDGDAYLKHFEKSGRPKTSFARSLEKQFGANNLNSVSRKKLALDSEKGRKIFAELARAADRTQATSKSLLFIDHSRASLLSQTYEKTGEVATQGAWTIAVRATAPRHGFANVPCAEFMSELVRQAYARAGYKAADDFVGDNALIWHKSAAVERLGRALASAGWGIWDAREFRPPVGAILMHESGRTPGHTYIAAGDDGRFVVDNGSPQGRDLRRTVERTLSIMYQTGVFFLPPGIEPEKWVSAADAN